MVKRALLFYVLLFWVLLFCVLAELAVAALLVWAVGLGWTLVILAGMFMAGVVLGASQIRNISPRHDPADSALVGLGAALVFLPGVVTTAVGLLILAPPTRGAVRPLATVLLTRGIARRITLSNLTPTGYGDYIDGEVDGEVIEDIPGNAVALSR